MRSPASMRATESPPQESILPCQPQITQHKTRRRVARLWISPGPLSSSPTRPPVPVPPSWGTTTRGSGHAQGRCEPGHRGRQGLRGDHPRVTSAPRARDSGRVGGDAGEPETVGRRYFLVDPLDGTKEFIKKRSDFTVNIALIEQGLPRFGLVYAPARRCLRDGRPPANGHRGRAFAQRQRAWISPSYPQKRLTVRTADPSGLTALVSRRISIPRPKPSSPSSRSPSAPTQDRPSSFWRSRGARPTSIPVSARPWSGTRRRGMPCSKQPAARSVMPCGDPLRYGKTASGLRNPSFIAWGQRTAGARKGGQPLFSNCLSKS